MRCPLIGWLDGSGPLWYKLQRMFAGGEPLREMESCGLLNMS
jgi:hypothetical protein